MRTNRHHALAAALFLSASTLAIAPVAAQETNDTPASVDPDMNSNAATSQERNGTVGAASGDTTMSGETAGSGGVENQASVDMDERRDAQETIDEAVRVAKQMHNDENMSQLLDRAQGVFIVPSYGKGAFLVGGSGGEGVLLTKDGGSWAKPAFYDIGSVSVGAAAGASGGSIAMLLMTNDAVASFMQSNNFSLNADADLTVVDYSANAQANAGKGDVIMWADTEGLFAGVSLSASDIVFDQEETSAFYGQSVTADKVLHGPGLEVSGIDALRSALNS